MAAHEAAREESREPNEHLRLLLDNVEDYVIFTCDLESRIVTWGAGAERILGYTEAEAMGREIGRFFIPEDVRKGVPEEVLERAASEGRAEGERWHVRKNGTRFWAAGVITPSRDESGLLQGFGAVLRDMTARKQAEDSHRLCEHRFRLLVEGVHDHSLFMMDPDGRITFWNAGAERMKGYREQEILGQHLSVMYPPESEAEAYEHLRQAEETGRYEGEGVRVRKDGSRFLSQVVITSIRDESGRIWGFAKVTRDLSERRRLEAELAASEARFRGIAEQSPALIWRTDAGGRYDYFNRTWCEFRGHSLEHEIGDGAGWLEAIHPEDRPGYIETFRAAFERREPFTATFRLLRRDGQYRWLTDRGTPYRDDGQTFLGYLGSSLDITDRVELESLLQQQRALAEEAARHKTRLMSAMSHDARTPLNAVVLSVDLLEATLGDHPDPVVVQDLRTIRNAVGNVLELLGDLLSLTRIDAGADPVEARPFALEPVLTECFASVEGEARQKGLDVRLQPGALAGATLVTDRTKLKRILHNFLSNAVRYTERGHIRLTTTRSADQVRISVEDTGVGIAPADQARVFDEFARLEQPHRPVGEGTGLGLAICRRLASLLMGEISLDSTLGQGSTFALVLPASVVASVALASNPDIGPESPGSGTILVADDRLAYRQMLAMVLRRMGYRVLEAANGRDAVELASRERLLAILMDIDMPVMDGIDATLALRAEPATRAIPIFALNGDNSLINRQRMGEAGVNGFLEKPVHVEALETALARLGN
jgi:PAS domain S-box-containing protein